MASGTKPRALSDKRPWLLASLAAALAYFIWSDENVGGLYLTILKGVPVALLAVYAFVRHPGADARLLGVVMVVGALGDWGVEFGWTLGGALFLLAHLIAIVLFLRNRRERTSGSQKAAAAALVVLTPLAAWLLSRDPLVALYASGLGAMAGAAWLSRFPRYRVGIGAVLFVISDLLLFARFGRAMDPTYAAWLVWPTYYAGQFLICTGVIQTLRKAPA